MLNAGIIARVSTDAQNDRGSLDIQVDKNLKYCNDKNINPVRIYKQVISGGNEEVLKTEVREDIERGLINCVVMWEVSRLARVASWILNEIDYFISKKVKVVIVSNPTLDVYNSNDKFMLTIQSGVAEFEKAKIIERSFTSMVQRKDNGERMAGLPPMGYTRIAKDKWEKNEEFEIILNAFETFNMNESANKTAQQFGWALQTLKGRFLNVSYIGKNNFGIGKNILSWNEVQNLPPLLAVKEEDMIPLELFKSVYLKFLRNSEKVRRGINSSPYLLSGLLWCSCGKKFAGNKSTHKGKDYSRYQCKCNKTIRKNKIEDAIIENLKNEIDNFDDINKFQIDIEKLKVKQKKLNETINKTKITIDKKHFERLKLLDNNKITLEDFDYLRNLDQEKLQNIRSQIINIDISIEQLEKRNKINNKEKLQNYIEKLEKIDNVQEKKKVFSILIDSIIIHSIKGQKDIEIEITYNF